MMKTFKGLLADNDVLRIRLHTNNGLTGYQIKKFLVLPQLPGAESIEAVMKVFTAEKDEVGAVRTANGTVNFNDPTLIGAAYYQDSTSAGDNQASTIILDNVTVNQDIFISYKEISTTGAACNFYIELEQMKLSHDEAAVATLKDMRAGPDTNFGS